MSNVNKVTIEGRLTRDPETKFTNSGKRVCSFAIAVNYSTKNEDGTWKNDNLSGYFDCTAWEAVAEAAGTFHKGDPVYIEGSLKQERWEQDGQKRSRVIINVREVRLADWARKAAENAKQPELKGVGDEEIPF